MGRKRKTTRKTRKRKTKRKGKVKKKTTKKSIPANTPKSRIAEALGIVPPKGCQLSMPTMKGDRRKPWLNTGSSGPWNPSLPELNLLGSESYLDYNDEPDEMGDAILAAGVRRNVVTNTNALIRRKTLSARALLSHTSIRQRVAHKPKMEVEYNNNSESVSDFLGGIIKKQSNLLKPLYKDVRKRIGENVSGRQSAPGPDSPSGNSGGEREAGSGGGGGGNGAEKGGGGGGSSGDGPVESGSSGSNVGATDPTGSKAYASHLKE